MVISLLDNPLIKEKCQIFTPVEVVSQMLNYANYCKNLYGKKILDLSSGNGRFLIEIVRRYIIDCIEKGLSTDQIKSGLSCDIWGYELDIVHFETSIANLNELVKEYGVDGIEWKIFNGDSLRSKIDEQFDYIVGNPPYLSYWDIPKPEREFIRGEFESCKNGASDYCFAFVERAISLLKDKGVLIYIVPSSIFKTRAGKVIRSKLIPLIRAIYDFKTKKVFDNALTSSAIILLDKSTSSDELSYHDLAEERLIKIDKSILGDLWIFEVKRLQSFKYKFGDFFKVSSSVATQRNKAFVLVNWKDDGEWLKGPYEEIIEMNAVRKAASPKGRISERVEHIIFPYYFEDQKRKTYSEEDYKGFFPYAYKHLLKHKEELLTRDSDDKAAWFEYGRSQALDHLSQKKILISSIVTNKVNIFVLDEADIPYSGFYIVPIGELTMDVAIQVLESNAFQEYVESVGINVSGNSIRITAKNISDFCW